MADTKATQERQPATAAGLVGSVSGLPPAGPEGAAFDVDGYAEGRAGVVGHGAAYEVGDVGRVGRLAFDDDLVVEGQPRLEPGVLEGDQSGGIPEAFALWILPLPPGHKVQHRSTLLHVPVARDVFVPRRVTSWDFRSVHFLVTHAASRQFPVDKFRWILGDSVMDRTGAWNCPPTVDEVRPDMFLDYHAGLLKHFLQLLAERGIHPEIDD